LFDCTLGQPSIYPSCGGHNVSSGSWNLITNGCNNSIGACASASYTTIIGGFQNCLGGKGFSQSDFNTDIVGKCNKYCSGAGSTSIASAFITFLANCNFALNSCLGTLSSLAGVMVASCNSTVSNYYSGVVGLQSCTTAANNTIYFDAITKIIGSFTIPHPDPAKKNTHTLSHNFVEAPTEGENIYRYQVSTINCQATIELPSYYKFLNKNTITKVSPVDTFGTGYAVLDSAMDCVTFTSNCEGKYNILLIGTRKDPDAIKSWCGVEPYRDSNNLYTGREV
jgi:hypothetical protein